MRTGGKGFDETDLD